MDQRNGQEIWRSPTSSESLSPPVHSGSHIILQTIDGRITGFNAKTGEQDWFHQTVVPTLTLRGTAWPYIDEGFIFTGFANGKIAMIYPDSGAVRLELPVTLNEGKSELERIVDVDGRSIIVNGILVSASYQGNILLLNLRDGRGIWQQELSTFKDLASNGNRIVAVDSKDIVKAFGTLQLALLFGNKRI